MDEIQPLAEWKTKKGVLTKVVPTSVTGTTSSSIKAYIQNAYNTWTPPPEYVLLVGYNNYIPMEYAGETEYGSFNSDHTYGNMDSDIYHEVIVGRFPAGSEDDVTVMVEKVMGYERTLYLASPDWLIHGTSIIREDGTPDDADYWAASDTMCRGMLACGYTQIDTFVNSAGDDAADVESAVNLGRAFVQYRGQGTTNWWSPFNVNTSNLHNTNRYPVVLSITCHTIAMYTSSSPQAGSLWMRDGSVSNPYGSVAFYGTTSTISHGADVRSAVATGFTSCFFSDTCNDIGVAAEAGRRRVWDEYADSAQCMSHVLLGDPEMDILTRIPDTMTISHSVMIPVGTESYTVMVTDHGSPIEGALVCAMPKDSSDYDWGYTNSSGQINFTINTTEAGTLFVTVTAHNYIAYEGYAVVQPSGPYLVFDSDTVDDAAGNSDGYLNPGENVNIFVKLRNDGVDPAYSVQSKLRTSDPYIAISDSIASYGAIPDGTGAWGSSPYSFTLSSSCPKGHTAIFSLYIWDSHDSVWTDDKPTILVHTADLVYRSVVVDDPSPGGNGNGILEPGESAKLILSSVNDEVSGVGATDLILRSLGSDIFVENSIAQLGSIAASESIYTDSSPYVVSVSPSAEWGSSVDMRVLVQGDGTTYTYRDTIDFSVNIGAAGLPVQGGPDGYGYYIYDDTDTLTGRAYSYDWVDITSVGTTIAGVTDADDAIATIPIPFSFVFYGQSHDSLSVGTDGFIAIGTETWSGGSGIHEIYIPYAGRNKGFVAPFWDDMDMRTSGDIYQYYDAANHRFIVEYYQCPHYGAPSSAETFEAIFFDPAYYSTPTGDGEIVVQYQIVYDASSNSLGIEDYGETVGFQYLYHNTYDASSAHLQAGRTIKYTTNLPVETSSPWLVRVGETDDDSGSGDGDGYPESGELVSIIATLGNEGTENAVSTTAKLRGDFSFLTITDSVGTFGTVSVGGYRDNTGDPFGVQISVLPHNTTIYLELALSANGGGYTHTTYLPLSLYVAYNVSDRNHCSFTLPAVYPNPFNSSCVISGVPEGAQVEIFDINGRAVYADRSSQNGMLIWSPDKSVGTGVYLYRISTDEGSIEGKIVVIK